MSIQTYNIQTSLLTLFTALVLASPGALPAGVAAKPAGAGPTGSTALPPSHTREEWIAKFDAFDAGFNQGKGLSETNDLAILGWNESCLLKAYLNMYQATRSVQYLDRFVSHLDRMIGPKGTWSEIVVAGKAFKGWTTRRYSHEKPYPYLVQDGMLSIPLARFACMVRAGETPPEYAAVANQCLAALEQHLIGKWETSWREIPGSNPPQAVYVNPADGSFKTNDSGRSLPYNQFLTMAETFAYLSRTKDYPLAAHYGKRAACMLQAAKQGMVIYDAGEWQAWSWHYWDPKLPTDPVSGKGYVEDIGHANLDVSAIVTGYELKIDQDDKPVFNEQDIRRLCNAFTRRIWQGEAAKSPIASRVDGVVLNKETHMAMSLYGWIRLGAYDPTLLKLIKTSFDAKVFPQQKCGATTVLQTISEIVLETSGTSIQR